MLSMKTKGLGLIVLALGLIANAVAGPRIERWVMSNGARVQLIESHVLPMLDVQIDFPAGSIFDPPGKSGLAALTRATLGLGAGSRDETAIAEDLADLGASLGGGADTDRANLSLRTLSAVAQREPALAILRDELRAPRFSPEIFAREQARTIAGLKDSMTRPDSIAGKAFWAALYPGHPYGREATPESVAAVTVDDLRAFHARYYTAKNASLTLVGDINRAQAEAIAGFLLEGLPVGETVSWPAPPPAGKAKTVAIAHPASQAHVYLGMPAIERGNPDFFPLLVGNYSLGGGGFVSRLMKEVRDKRGYAYSVYSYFMPLRQTGPFQIGLQTKRNQARDALKLAREILDDFVRNGPSADELAAAKANLSGSFPLRLDSNRKLLDNAAAMAFYGLPEDYLDTYQARIQAVTVDQVKAAFARHVRPRDLVTVTVAAD